MAEDLSIHHATLMHTHIYTSLSHLLSLSLKMVTSLAEKKHL
jgi:hypothetical protein